MTGEQETRRELQKPSVGEFIELYELDYTIIVAGATPLRFTSTKFTSSSVTWKGDIYDPVDVESEGWERSAGGGMPTPLLRLSVSGDPSDTGTFSSILKALIINNEGLTGATITRTRTLRKFLDGEPSADPAAQFPTDLFKVDTMTRFTKHFVEWELRAFLDQEGKKIPGRQVISETCSHTYRRWDGAAFIQGTCPYTGVNLFERDGTPTANEFDDVCGKRVSDCKLRFVFPEEIPHRGFPGVKKART